MILCIFKPKHRGVFSLLFSLILPSPQRKEAEARDRERREQEFRDQRLANRRDFERKLRERARRGLINNTRHAKP